MKKISTVIIVSLVTAAVLSACSEKTDGGSSTTDLIRSSANDTALDTDTGAGGQEMEEITPDGAAETEEVESEVYLGYLEASNIYYADLEYDTRTEKYYYNDLKIIQDEIDFYKEWGKEHGVEKLSSDALYRSLVRRVETFYGGQERLYGNWKLGSAPYFFDFELPEQWEDMKPYVDDIAGYITNDGSLMAILHKFSQLETIEGEFDFDEESTATVSGSYHFYIPDVEATAEELGITDRLLGYILAALDVYPVEAKFEGRSYSCELDLEPANR